MMKKILNIIYWTIILAILSIAAATAFSVIEAPGGWRSFIILSGSMEPKIHTGSVVLVKKADSYQKDEVITYKTNNNVDLKKPGSTVTHRVYAIRDESGKISYTTKGDANSDVDPEMIPLERVLGKVQFNIPYLGYVSNFAKSQIGFVTLIVIPGTLIIYSEAMNIKKEVIKIYKSKTKKTEKKDEDQEAEA